MLDLEVTMKSYERPIARWNEGDLIPVVMNIYTALNDDKPRGSIEHINRTLLFLG